jgi:hypothetical protein
VKDNVIIKPTSFYSKVFKLNDINLLKTSKEEKEKRISELEHSLVEMKKVKDPLDQKAISRIYTYAYASLLYCIVQQG